jgi:hypothetical protein
MKKLLLLLLIAPVLSYGQDYLDEMALDACLCIEEDIINRKKPLKKNKYHISLLCALLNLQSFTLMILMKILI